jgi:sensor c-di-GMP phosphodiesterase-like protein
MLAFNHWFDAAIVRQGVDDVEGFNRRSIHIAESRIDLVVAALAELKRSGVDACSPSQLLALRKANFGAPWVKEFSIIAADGQTLCSDLGLPLQPRVVVSSHPAKTAGVILDVVRMGERSGRMVRIRQPTSGGNSLAAIISPDLLMAKLVLHGNAGAGYGSLTMTDGTLIDEAGLKPADRGAMVVRSLHSDRYGLKVSVSLVRLNGGSRLQDLQGVGALITALFAIVILGFAFLLPWRGRDNPVAELERALRAGEFVPFYQPIVDITTGRLRGAEVLMRWKKRDGSILPPVSFIPLAESSGLIVEMTRHLMSKVCEEMGPACHRRPSLLLSFNLAARHFTDESIVGDLRNIFEGSPLRLSQIVLEVTERQPLENLTGARRVIATLQGLGVKVAIDDVGAGHSGLSYMLKLGVDIIKIDKMFIDALGSDSNSITIVETLVDLARNMRMEIIAEGVENFEQVVALRERGIKLAQGYVFAPPLPGSSFLQLLEAIDPQPQLVEKPLQPFRYISVRQRASA